MNGNNIIENAFIIINQRFPLVLNYLPEKNDDGNIKLELEFSNANVSFITEFKKTLKIHQIPRLVERRKEDSNFLVLVGKMTPKVRQVLQENGINYIEGNGNCYIQTQNQFIFIDNLDPIKIREAEKNRAFTKTGLIAVFHFLLDPNLLFKTQREIAKITDVSLATVSFVIAGLKHSKLIAKTKKGYTILNYEKLMNKWIAHYGETLRPSLFKGKFKFIGGKSNWESIHFKESKTSWGGEPAGSILTNYLIPGEFSMYTEEAQKELMKEYKMIPSETGRITVYKKFWNQEYDQKKTVPPLLAYADLILTGESRCLETAKMILDEYIRPRF